MPVARDKLYEEVWAEPMTAVAGHYGVSSSYLARICERLRVPRPGRGHWTQVEMGKQPQRPPLPEVQPGAEHEWFLRGEKPPPLKAPRVAELPVPAKAAKGAKPHALLASSQHFKGARTFKNGYLRPTKGKLVDVVVSESGLRHAIRYCELLVTALEARGCTVGFAPWDSHLRRLDLDHRSEPRRDRPLHESWRPDRPTVVYIGTLAIGLTLFEMSEETDVRFVDDNGGDGKYVRVAEAPRPRRPRAHEWVHATDMPSGRFALRAYSPYHHGKWERLWREAKRDQFSAMTDEIADELVREAPKVAALIEEATRTAELEAERDRERTREWLRKHEQQERAARLEKSRAGLLQVVDEWARAKRIEQFLDEIQRALPSYEPERRAALEGCLEAARRLIGDSSPVDLLLAWRENADD